MDMLDVMRVRAVAHMLVGLVNYDVYIKFGELFTRKLRQRIPERMRPPTLNEIRMVDKLIHEEVIAGVARGTCSLEQGLERFVSEEGLRHSF